MKYFISFALKAKDTMMSPITQYGNIVIDLPHEIIDDTDISDLQGLISSKYEGFICIIIFIQKMPI